TAGPHRVSYSTISIALQEAARPRPITPPESYSSAAVASTAARSLVGFAQSAWSLLIWIAVWSVVWRPGSRGQSDTRSSPSTHPRHIRGTLPAAHPRAYLKHFFYLRQSIK
ncbi:MAG: hypothetical protein LC772_06470, partial [Chloroflexi bacterium]|nr:hypothetical protein [Chloroflexota bacterium]